MAGGTGPGMTYSVPGEITVGKEMQRGFINDKKTKASWGGCSERIEKRGTCT